MANKPISVSNAMELDMSFLNSNLYNYSLNLGRILQNKISQAFYLGNAIEAFPISFTLPKTRQSKIVNPIRRQNPTLLTLGHAVKCLISNKN